MGMLLFRGSMRERDAMMADGLPVMEMITGLFEMVGGGGGSRGRTAR